MKSFKLIPLALVVACSSGPTKEESVRAFTAATSAMTSAQSRAVTAARAIPHAAPSALTVDFNGPCLLGGSVAVAGSYDDAGSGSSSTFDLSTTFAACKELDGTLDGNLHWTSVAAGTTFSATMNGSLDYTDSNGTATCDFDLHLTVDAISVTYTGTVCGYDVQADLHIAH